MKIGVWLNNDMLPQEGGAYTYIHSLVKLLDEESFEQAEIVFLAYKQSNTVSSLKKKIFYLNDHFSKLTFFYKLLRRLSGNHKINGFLTRSINKHTSGIIKELGIDYVYYLNQAQRELDTVPFIATNWDIAHLSLSTFPEFSEQGQSEKRKQWYEVDLKKAALIAVESEAGKEELIRYLKIPADKIVVVPFFIRKNASPVSDKDAEQMLKTYDLPKEHYFYYPAQYWKHKNHTTLVKAFKCFREKNPGNTKLVFSGSDKGELASIKEEIAKLGLTGQILCLGFIAEKEKEVLLSNALSLVMPTFLGPTNLPPLEALEYGIPSVCSDLAGHKEMLGNSALYFDPASQEELCDALCLISRKEERTTYTDRINTVKKGSVFNYSSAKTSLDRLFNHLKKQAV